MMVALAVLALSPSGHALSVDAWFRGGAARDATVNGPLSRPRFCGLAD